MPLQPSFPDRVAALVVFLSIVSTLGCASRQPAAPQPYVFGWPFAETAELTPRGGTTRGPDVVLEETPTEDWQRLRESGLTTRERDRAAILALAGEYRTSFDFLETVLYEPGEEPARPYRSWGTEKISVLETRADFVSLQHILTLFVIVDGERQGPFVQKHWRQDWQYEPSEQLVFLGHGRFTAREIPPEQRRGAWSQTVYHVDDSPRYASIGRWDHDPQRSVWEGSWAWRPVPRRERSVRQDYQVLAGRHRLTVLPTGWVHEQDNDKLVVSAAGGRADRSRGKEIGLNRYERIRDFDFSAADAYWRATETFWAAIRQAWSERLRRGEEFGVAPTCDGEPGFVASFSFAHRLEAEGSPGDAAIGDEARRIVDCLDRE